MGADADSAYCRASIASMESRELVCKSILEREGFRLHVYEKMRAKSDNVLELENGDFVVATGTCIYKKKIGNAALRLLYSDFSVGELSFENFLGLAQLITHLLCG